MLASGMLTLGIAGTEQQLLNFSREHEVEADQLGLKILCRVHYDPKATLDFFQRLSQSERYSPRLPQLLLTHPWIEEQIAQVSHWLVSMNQYAPDVSLNFYLVRERIRVELTNKLYDLLLYYQQLLQYGSNKLGAHDGYVLALLCLNQPKLAVDKSQPLLKTEPKKSLVLLALGQANLKLGNHTTAIQVLEAAYALELKNLVFLSAYTQALIQSN